MKTRTRPGITSINTAPAQLEVAASRMPDDLASLGARRARATAGRRARDPGAGPDPAGRARPHRRDVDPVRRRARGDAVRRGGPGRDVGAAPGVRRDRPAARLAPVAPAARPAGAAPRRGLRPDARRDEPHLLRGARPHPARRRGDDRVPRADHRRDAARRAGGWTSSGSRSRRSASCCSPRRGRRAAALDSVGVAFALVAAGVLGRSTSCSPSARGGSSTAARAWRSRWSGRRSSRSSRASPQAGTRPARPGAAARRVRRRAAQQRRSRTRWRPRRCAACRRASSGS